VINRNVRNTSVAAYLVKKALDEYNHNKLHYSDMWSFFFSEAASDKEYTTVCFSDLPPKERKKISRIYKRFRHLDTSEIFEELGTRATATCKHSPLEAKWAYTYFRKFRSWEYFEDNEVSVEEILHPLSSKELKEYLSLF